MTAVTVERVTVNNPYLPCVDIIRDMAIRRPGWTPGDYRSFPMIMLRPDSYTVGAFDAAIAKGNVPSGAHRFLAEKDLRQVELEPGERPVW